MTLQNPVRLDGTYDERVPDFQGKLVRDHDPEIVAALERSRAALQAGSPTSTPTRTAGAATRR